MTTDASVPSWEDLLASPHLTFTDPDLLPHLLAFGPPPALPPRPWLYDASTTTTARADEGAP